MGVQPFFYEDTELFQLPLVRAEYRQVIHVADIVLAQPAFTNKPVKRLQNGICEPLRGISSNQHAVLDDTPNKVKNEAVFNKLSHSVHNNLWLQAVIEMMDVAAKLILRAFRVVQHPILDSFSGVMRASATNAPAAVIVHAAHHLRL